MGMVMVKCPQSGRAIPTGIWNCGASPCAPDTVVQSAMSCGQLVAVLY